MGSKRKTRTTSFPQFARLPPELRAMVWEHCLPRRIIPMSMIVLAHDHHLQPSEKWEPSALSKYLWSILGEPCRVEQICRESRAVAHLRRQPVEALGMPWLGRGSYIDHRTDTIILDCDIHVKYRKLWRDTQQALGLGTAPEHRCVRIGMREEFTWYRTRRESGNKDALCDPAPLPFKQTEWPVLTRSVYMNMPQSAACKTGRFGVFGEERAALIHLRDGTELDFIHELRNKYTGLGTLDSPGMAVTMLCNWEDWKDDAYAASREAGIVIPEGEGPSGETGPYPVMLVKWKDWRIRDDFLRHI